MAYWLMKSEPDVFGWDDQVKRGAEGEPWTGVRAHAAKLNLMKMKKGDKAFFYHSNIGKEIVGVVEIVKEAYPDPTAEAGAPWVCVDTVAMAPFKTPVTLDYVKTDPELSEMALIKFSRLSVQPVTADEWKHICKLGGVKG
jgi:predicted RNA-binding protein with PUA-like domain